MAEKRAVATAALLGLVVALLAFASPQAQAQSSTVTVSEGESIQAAIEAAAEGTTIVVESGVYEESLHISTDGISLLGEPGATIKTPADADTPCTFFGVTDSICVAAAPFNEPMGGLLSSEVIEDVTVSGFTIVDSPGTAIDVMNSRNSTVSDNTVTGAACNGIWMGDSERFKVSGNTISDTGQVLQFCAAIDVTDTPIGLDSTRGLVAKNKLIDNAFAGIVLSGTTKTTVKQNKVTKNCGGIAVAAGSAKPNDTAGVKVLNNKVQKNNKACQPFIAFGIDTAFGGYGIAVAGGAKVTIKKNTVKNNVVNDDLITQGAGISAIDFTNLDGTTAGVNKIKIINNKATGNSVNGVANDIGVITEKGKVTVKNNTCDVSVADPSWCNK